MPRLTLPLTGLAALALSSCLVEQGGPPPPSSARARKGGAEVAFPGKPGIPRMGTLYGEPVRYRQVDGHAVVGGDIVLDPEALATGALKKEGSVGRTAAASRWVNNQVYYRFAAGFSRATEANAAMAHWEANTLVRFVQWNSTLSNHPDLVEFQSTDGAGCWSGGIGRMGGVQVINLDASCSAGNAIHEIGHAVGLYHEQSRSDQASMISVDFNNLPASAKDRYYVFSNPLRAPAPLDGADHGAMDFGSVMMDGSFDFALDPAQPVMKRLSDNSTWTAQRTALSTGDIAGIGDMYPSFWKTVPGPAIDIGVGPGSTAWMLSTVPINGGYQTYKWTGTAWSAFNGGALRLDVETSGVLWVVNSYGDMYSLSGTAWTNRSAGKKFNDVGVGSEGSVFGVTKTASGSGYQLVKRSGTSWATFASGGATRVTVDNTGKPWIVNAANQVQRWNGTAWVTLPGTGTDIGAGPDGSVYLIENVAAAGGKAVSVWNGIGWSRLDKGGIAIDVGAGGNPWMPTATGSIWVGSGVAGAVAQTPPSAVWNSESVAAIAIGVGGTAQNPVAWALTATDVYGGKAIHAKSGQGAWQTFEGGLIALDVSPTGELWGINIWNDLYSNTGTGWNNRSAGLKFTEVSNGSDGSVFAITMTPSGKGFELVKWTGSGWSGFASGGAVKVAVDNSGKPWIIDNEGATRRWDGSSWLWVPGSATDIGIGGDGTVYKVGTTAITGGKTVFRWSGSAWVQIDAAAVALDVDAAGNPWLVGPDNTLKAWSPGATGASPPVKTPPDGDPNIGAPPGSWQAENVLATDIGVGGTTAALSAWAASTGDVNGGRTLYKKTGIPGAPWQLTTGGLLRLDAEPSGVLWVVNSYGDAYSLSGTTWTLRSGGNKFHDIAVGGEGTVYAVSQTATWAGFQLLKWNGMVWSVFPSGGAVRVSVDQAGRPWIVNSRNAVYRWDGSAWIVTPGSGTDIGAGGGKVYKLGSVEVTGGKTVWSWTGSAWSQLEGAAVAVDADPSGNPYLAQSDFSVRSWAPGIGGDSPPLKAVPDADPDTLPPSPVPGTWITETNGASEIGVGGSMGAIAALAARTTSIGNDRTLMRKVSGTWSDFGGGGLRVDADPAGKYWLVNSVNDIYYYSGSWALRSVGRKFQDVGVGQDGSVFAVTTETLSSEGNILCKWTGSGWNTFQSSGAVRVSVDGNGRPWIVTALNAVKRWDGTGWVTLPGSATDIAAGPDGIAYKVGTVSVLGGNKALWRWNGSAWSQLLQSGKAIDVDPAGNPWVINGDGYLKSWSPGLPADAPPPLNPTPDPDPEPDPAPPIIIPGSWQAELNSVVGVAAGGVAGAIEAAVLSMGVATEGNPIKVKGTGTGQQWQTLSGGAVTLDADQNGRLWTVSNTDEVRRYDGAWISVSPGQKFLDVAVGSEGSVFAVSKVAPAPSGRGLFKWSGFEWIEFPSNGAVKVAVDNSGNPWIVNADYAVQRWTGTAWSTLPGTASDISVGGDGTAYKLGVLPGTGAKGVWRWNGSSWIQIEPAAKHLDVDPSGRPWLVKDDGQLIRWEPGTDLAPPPPKPVPDADPEPGSPGLPPATVPNMWFQLAGASADLVAFTGQFPPVGFGLDKFNVGIGGYALKWFANGQSTPLARRFVDMDMAKDCEAWAVADSGTLWFNANACADPNAWQPGSAAGLPAFGKIAAGPTGTDGSYAVYAITKPTPYEQVYRREANGTWVATPLAFNEIDVASDGILWARVGYAVGPYYPGSDGYPITGMPGVVASRIATGGGRLVGLSHTAAPGGMQAAAWTYPAAWTVLSPGQGFTDITVAASGMIWAADDQHRVWYMNPDWEPGMTPPPPFTCCTGNF